MVSLLPFKHSAFICIFFCLFALAQEKDPSKEKKAEVSDPVVVNLVVTAQFGPETEKGSVYPVKVISEERIRQQGAVTVRELLQHELNIDLEQHSVFGSSLSLNGVSKENVKILIDGMPVIGRLNGMIDLDQISLEGVKRVEIIEGPVSLYYGSDALAGVVHLITDGSTRDGWHGETGLGLRSLGDELAWARVAFAKGDHAVSAQLNVRRFDGYDGQIEDRERDWNNRDQSNAQLRYRTVLGSQVLHLQSWTFDETSIDAGNLDAGKAQDLYYQTQRANHQVGLRGAITDRTFSDFIFGFSDYDRRSETLNIDFSGPTQVETGPFDQDKTTLNQWLSRGMITVDEIGKGMDLQVGYEWSSERGAGARLGEGSRQLEDGAVFASLRIGTTHGLIIQPGIRANYNSIYRAPLTPALHLKWDPGSNQAWRASYSQGFRGPSLKEVFLDFTIAAGPFIYHITGNEALKAERGDHYRISWDGSWGKWLGGDLGIKTAVYYYDIDDLIALSTLTPDPELPNRFNRQYININQHKSRGANLEANLRGTRWYLTLATAYGSQRNQLTENDGVPDFSGYWEAKSQMGYGFGKNGPNFSLFYKYRGPKPGFIQTRSGQILELELREAHQLDMSADWELLGPGIVLEAGAKNLFDTKNLDEIDLSSGAAHTEEPVGWGTTFYGRLRWRF